MKIRLVLIVFVVGFSLLSVICLPVAAAQPASPPPPPTAPMPMMPPASPAVNPSEVAVTVNGFEITEGQVEEAMAPHLRRYTASSSQMPPGMLDQVKLQIRPRALDQLILDKLLEAEIQKVDIKITEQDVIDHLTEIAARQRPPMSLEDFKKRLASVGQDFEKIKKQLMETNGIKYKKLIDSKIAGKVKVIDKDVEKYYNDNKQKFENPELCRASHILITPDEIQVKTDPNAAKAKAKAKAEELLKKLKTDKADFATLAKANSSCPSSAKGGDLGFFQKRQMVKEFSDAAFAMKAGQISDVVETQFGFHIIRTEERKEAGITPFEEAKADVRQTLMEEQQRKYSDEYFNSLKAKAAIVYPPGKEPKPAPPMMGMPR
ncbi:MAG: peptidylprolyl isomerase [Planctomycetota bacterium]|jgi:peptidyl-prolyl cis-trans isomerase C